MFNIMTLLNTGVSVLIALVLHELAHAYVSYKLGDPTPKVQGRLTLNPAAHLDLFGTFCLFFFGFGWAKPVSINYNYYKNVKLGTTLVSLAGPFMNFLIALIAGIGLKLVMPIGHVGFTHFFTTLMTINVGLGVFNLIPFPPLDGSKVVASLLPNHLYDKWMMIEQYGMFILMALLFTGILDPFLNGLMGFVYSIVYMVVGL